MRLSLQKTSRKKSRKISGKFYRLGPRPGTAPRARPGYGQLRLYATRQIAFSRPDSVIDFHCLTTTNIKRKRTMKKATRFDEDRMTRREPAEYLGLAYGTLGVWASTGRGNLPFHKLGGKVYYRKTELDRWIEENRRTKTPI